MPPPKRQFRPGHRNNPKAAGRGRMSENRYAFLTTLFGTFQIMRYQPDEEEIALGPTVTLYIPRESKQDISFDLTALTTDELNKLEEFFHLLIAEARPIVAERDRIAHEAFESGDDSFTRVYRQVPQLVVRKRTSR